MTTPPAPDEAMMQARLAELLGAPGAPAHIADMRRAFGGNARQAFAFDAAWPDGRRLPCIMLAQVGGKHVESDIAAEFAVLRALGGSGVRAPAALLLDAEGVVAGGPALVLERIAGKASAVDFLDQPDNACGRELTADLARATGDLHRFDWQAAGLAAEDADPVDAQIAHWQAQFRAHRLEPHPVLEWLFGWLRAHVPRPVRLALVHGDLRPGNFLYEGARLTALLDWEMAHIGDPAEDIAWIYRALWSPARFLPLDDFLARHAASAGFAIPRRSVVYYRIFSEAKFAAISLSAAHRFASGSTRNLRHINRAAKVPECLRLALDWIAGEDWEARDAAA